VISSKRHGNGGSGTSANAYMADITSLQDRVKGWCGIGAAGN